MYPRSHAPRGNARPGRSASRAWNPANHAGDRPGSRRGASRQPVPTRSVGTRDEGTRVGNQLLENEMRKFVASRAALVGSLCVVAGWSLPVLAEVPKPARLTVAPAEVHLTGPRARPQL